MPFRPGWISSLAAVLLTGCPNFGMDAPGGTVEGSILYGGRAAPGKVVSLLFLKDGTFGSPTSGASTASSDTLGEYRFKGVPGGTYRVTFLSHQVADGAGIPMTPSEVGTWRTKARDVTSGSGARMVPFDIAYNGLIYPQTGSTFIVSQDAPLPFHWSTHATGQRYQLKIYPNRNGREPVLFTSDWNSVPTALFARNVTNGLFSWEVVIDGGDAGEGRSFVRQLDMAKPGQPAGGGVTP